MIELSLALVATLCAVLFGPLQLAVRAVLRKASGRQAVIQWQSAATVGTAIGLLAAPLVLSEWAIAVSVVGLLILLSIIDLAWRWLPYEWTLPLLGLGLAQSVIYGQISDAILGAAIGGGFLFAMQFWFRLRHGGEGLGTGDIWLAAGLGSFSGPQAITLIIALAAVTGIVESAVASMGKAKFNQYNYPVAYGAHLSAAFLVLCIFMDLTRLF